MEPAAFMAGVEEQQTLDHTLCLCNCRTYPNWFSHNFRYEKGPTGVRVAGVAERLVVRSLPPYTAVPACWTRRADVGRTPTRRATVWLPGELVV